MASRTERVLTDEYYGTDVHGRRTEMADYGAEAAYGGSREAAAKEIGDSERKASEWDSRYSQSFEPAIDFRRAEAARVQAGAAREEQMYGQEAARAQAMGRGPSQARAEFSSNVDQAAQAQAAAMAGGGSMFGRPGGSSLAAQAGGQQAMGGYAGQMGAGVAGETNAGRMAFAGGAGDMRQGDIGQMGYDAARQKALVDAQYNQRELADKMNNYYAQQAHNARTAGMQGVRAAKGNQFQRNAAYDAQGRARTAAERQDLADGIAVGGAMIGTVASGGASAGSMAGSMTRVK